MKTINHIIGSTRLFVVMLVWLLAYVGTHLWPASFWLEVDRVSAGPSHAGEPVIMTAERSINRPFLATWTVTVRQWQGGGWVTHCYATGSSQYRHGADLPANLTLDWWTGGACKRLDAGRYVIGTIWQIEPSSSFFPSKQVSVESNIFEVTP
jgi:hypothetical protein